MSKVTIVDYGLGNVFSVKKILERCGAEVEISSDPEVIRLSDKLVLPGVGAFKQGMKALRERGLDNLIYEYARSQKPLLGICLGMQMLFELGTEFGECKGLGLIPGSIDLIVGKESDGSMLRVPHIGWNALVPNPRNQFPLDADINPWADTLLDGLPVGASFVYFLHSYAARPTRAEHVLAYFVYGNQTLVAAVRHGEVWGCQFHPERSGELGVRIMQNFVRLTVAS
jgi:glutamine amidotransferase